MTNRASTPADAQPMPGSRRIAAAAASANPPTATMIFHPDPTAPTDFVALFSEPLPGFVTAPATDDSAPTSSDAAIRISSSPAATPSTDDSRGHSPTPIAARPNRTTSRSAM